MAGFPEDAKKIYPVLLVYDLEKLTKLTELYSVELPGDIEERAKVILYAFVLDYPKSQAEVKMFLEEPDQKLM